MDKVSANIFKTATEALNKRISSSKNYSEQELRAIENLDHRLFSRETLLDSDTTELLRGLCASYPINKDFTITKSHRPVIGPIIYFCKKILSRILRPLLKTQFSQIENFNRMAVLSIAKLYRSSITRRD